MATTTREEGGSVRPDGSIRRVRRIREGPARGPARYAPPRARQSSEAPPLRSLSALPPEPALPPVEVLPPDHALPEGDDSALLAWLEASGNEVALVFRGRSRSQRAALYAEIERSATLAGESTGFGADRTLTVRRRTGSVERRATSGRPTHQKRKTLDDGLWRFVQSERDLGALPDEAGDVSRGELADLFQAENSPPWLGRVRRKFAEDTVRRARAVDAVVAGDVAAVVELDRSLLFHHEEGLLHLAVEHRQLAVLRALVLQHGLDPRRTFHRGESALHLAGRLSRDDEDPILAFLHGECCLFEE